MTTTDIYEWLFTNIPENNNNQLRGLWSNMASYCYFVNAMDFDNVYQDSLQKLLNISKRLGIQIPDDNHKKVLDMASQLKRTGTISDMQ